MSEPSPVLSSEPIYDRTFWLAYVANTLLVLANALTFRFAELVAFLGGSERVAGDIVALALSISVVARLSVSHLIDELGTRRMWTCCALLFIAGGMMFLLCDQLNWFIYAARIVFVVGLTGMFACSVTHIQNHVPPHRRTEVIGNLGSSGFIGMIVGSNLGDGIYHAVPPGRPQFLALFGLATLIGLVYLGLVLCLTHGQQHERLTPARPAYVLVFHHWPGTVVAAAMIMGLNVTVTTVFLTRFATSRSIEGIGAFFTGYAISAFAFRILIATWSRTIGRHWMLVRGLLAHTVGYVLMSFAAESWHLVLPSVVCGFGHALLFPAVVSLGAGTFPKEARGAGTAIILGFTDFGSLVFSPILGRVIVAQGFEAMFWTSSGLSCAIAALYTIIALRYPDTEADEYRVATLTPELE